MGFTRDNKTSRVPRLLFQGGRSIANKSRNLDRYNTVRQGEVSATRGELSQSKGYFGVFLEVFDKGAI